MRNLLASAAIGAALVAGSVALANEGSDNGNKNGWVADGTVPKGLVVSAANGRVDNGGGNGGESARGTPIPDQESIDGEDSPRDQDPN